MRNMPWYKNPATTCKVLDRIAQRYERASLQQLRNVLDYVTESIWRKQLEYCKSTTDNRKY
jgi:hypothetical protein